MNSYIYELPQVIGLTERINYIENKIEEKIKKNSGKTLKILSFGSGSAIEVERIVNKYKDSSCKIEFYLLDKDCDALICFADKIESVISNSNNIKIKYLNYDLLEFIKNVRSKKTSLSGSYDLIYCIGMFDYFSDKNYKSLANFYYKILSSGGECVIITIKNGNPEEVLMDFSGDWSLISRSKKLVESLMPKSSESSVIVDKTKTHLYAIFKK